MILTSLPAVLVLVLLAWLAVTDWLEWARDGRGAKVFSHRSEGLVRGLAMLGWRPPDPRDFERKRGEQWGKATSKR